MLAHKFISAAADERRVESISDIESFQNSTTRMDAILKARGLALRVTLGTSSLVIGNRSERNDIAELIFQSQNCLEHLFRKMRLFDFAMAYIDGSMEVRGPMFRAIDVFDAINVVTDRRQTIWEYLSFLAFRISKAVFPKVSTRFESLEHYSQSAQAYELFLDSYMQYTCGRFESGTEDIDQAQEEKFKFIERLVRAHTGPLIEKNHLDIGCGWGGLVAYFGSNFGTHSVGNTNCAPQLKYARRRFGCEVIHGDFMQLNELDRQFDVITVVGMVEHLTPYRRSQLLNTISNLLTDNGVVYLQCIAKPKIWIGGDAYRLAAREVFQGHCLEYREQMEKRFVGSGFAILEVFDHAADYGLTTARWVEKIEANEYALIRILGERQYRLYLGYLAYGSKLFSTGRGSLMRYVLKKVKQHGAVV